MSKSIVHLGDSYKYSHASQYPKNIVSMYSYMESRGGLYPATVFTGLQYYIKKYLTVPVTFKDVLDAKAKADAHGIPFDFDGWNHIVSKHDGLLPIRIKAIREGSLVPTKHVLMTIESTDPEVPWIAGFVETLLMKIWYPTTIATKSYYTRKMLEKYGDPAWAKFAYHNFGDRGATSVEAAAIGGFAHLTQFMGTDNFNSLDFCEEYYNANTIAGFSVYASEHSTTTSYGKDGEEQFVYDQLVANPNAPIMSFVADSYDVYNFTNFCTAPDSRIRKLVESRPNQKFVLRPDSGEPIEVLDGMITIMRKNKLRTVPHEKHLFQDFGILWGDGITIEIIEAILIEAERHNFASENFVFGSGGDLMQNVNRDTQRFAIKCSSITVSTDISEDHGGEDGDRKLLSDIDVYKDPITDPGKASKRGKVTTWFNTETKEYCQGAVGQQPSPHHIDALLPIFENGRLLREYSLENIRNRTN